MKIDIYSMVGLIDPPVPMLEPYLKYANKRFEAGGPLGYQEREESMEMWGEDHRDRMVIAAGLVPRVQQVLADHGYRVTLTDHRKYGKPFAIDRKFLRSAAGEDRRLLDSVRQEPIGQIEVQNFRDMIATMRMIVDLYPKAHVLILVTTKELARKVRWKLNEAALGFAVELMGHSWPSPPPRCLVSTFAPMHRCRTDEWEIVLLPDPRGAVGNVGSRDMGQWLDAYDKQSHRFYSFVRPEMRMGRRDRLRLEAISGQAIYRLGPEHVGVRVLWLPTPDCAVIATDATALVFKRKAYWHNGNRNEYIAAVARAFVNCDAGKLAEYGVPFRNYAPALRHMPRSKVAVLVASTEQAREMAKRLPGWEILSTVAPGSTQKAGAADTDCTGKIITEAGTEKGGLDADVLIRASGSSGSLCFKGFPPPLGKDTRDVILVDFTDDYDNRAVQDARRRDREYELMGWESGPGPGKEARVESK